MSEATATATAERLSGREAAIARRQALSLHGKSALKAGKTAAPKSATEARMATRASAPAPTATATPAAPADKPSCSCQHGETYSARVEAARPAPDLTPAPIPAARRRRMEQSLKGRGDAAPCRPCGRVRPEPPKVEIGTTLAGSTVTGNQVERTTRVTGNEAGTCRTVTGTEYVGAEQFGEFCGTLPEPSPAKVATTSTSRGRRVTGTEVGRSTKVTGDETGTCKRVTGTEYLAAEQSGEFCGTAPEPRPEKAVTGMTAGRNAVSGSDLARTTKVTGGEAGAGRSITGSAYTDASLRPATEGNGPKKVETRRTSAGATVSGTLPGRSSKLSGDEPGACARVTGSDYVNTEEFKSFCRAEPYQSPAKVGVSRTLKGQDVSGTQVGRSAHVTGDEHGACKPVTGTSYIGADQYAEFCAARTAAEAINRARLGRNADLTGTQPGPDDKMTGNERGECQPVSGTPYVGESQIAAACGRPPMAAAYRSRGPEGSQPPAAITGSAMDAGQGTNRTGDFSVVSPARAAQSSETRRVTGSAYGVGGRITGPLARATGLVSGTPEFRYRDDTGSVAVPAAPQPAAEAAPERITGEGRERRITGDAWDRGDRVTGTEGRSAQRRNPTLRGDPRGNGATARDNREIERPAAAASRITGSSGNASSGAAITVSGGARG
ncbi:CsoS2 family carboxysome shell protein [Thiobacillus sedimenti]|uniref:CsoS2 family carboxysome shell protein n=1 Tax=Thiobacillus sedimenti TaxID=3110231 RepID=A0ABZ1CJG2_9PROT|nr:CsoS2 family carboxysome shell protein [Thiobacillus sp. SCUT-2]WRS39100.1 CsoS2 family carboxysome shell protein [Thiobacillus sp. SCUT-2]